MVTTENPIAKLADKDLAIARGSIILVTGASSHIGSHVVNEALLAGYKVRGTARTQDKCDKTKTTFGNHPNYTTAVVANYNIPGTFDEAVEGCAAIIHVAGDTTMRPDPNEVIKPAVEGVRSILQSAAKTPSVKRFVLTSSSSAAMSPQYEKPYTAGVNDWNQAAVDAATKQASPGGFEVYAASKTEAEKALWKFMQEENPPFVANAILPNLNTGRILSSAGATGGFVLDLLKGNMPFAGSQWQIDVIDDARLHLIAAVLDSSLQNQRIWAFAFVYTWTEIIEILKELRPNTTTLAKPPPNEPRDLSKVPNELGGKLLKQWYGQETGYKPLRQSIEENIEGVCL